MKRLIAVFMSMLIVICSLAVASCNQGNNDTSVSDSTHPTKETETQTAKDLADQAYELEDVADMLKLLGRAAVVEDGIACDMSATGIAFNAYIGGELTVTAECTSDTYFTVYVDDVRLDERFLVTSESKSFTIALEEETELHKIRIVKQTEAQVSLCVLDSMSFYGVLDSAEEDKELYIEFIGDSIPAGYGNLCENGTKDPQLAKYQDGTKAFAYLAAEGLGADCSVVSCSGIGLVKGYTDFTVSDFYPLTCRYRSQTEQYGFERVPDIVVINLGTNDASKGASEMEFKTAVRALIENARDAYEYNMPIVWCYGMMGEGCISWVQDVINEMGAESSGLYTLELPHNQNGGNGHPTAEAQAQAAALLTDFIKAKGLAD